MGEDEDEQTQKTGELHQLSGVTRAASSAAIEAPIRIFALRNGVIADNTTVLQQHTVSDVPLQRNYKTTIHGAIFAKEPQLSISVSSDFAG